MSRPLFLDSDDEPEYALTKKATADGTVVAANGLTGHTVRISATDGGTAIHPSLSQPLIERSEAPGVYFATLQGNDLRTYLNVNDDDGNPIYIGKTVYEVLDTGQNSDTSEPRLVVERRRPD